MKQTLIRLILFVLFAMLLLFVFKYPAWMLGAFILTYIFEGAVTQISNK